MWVCNKCQGSMFVERAVDLELGLSILLYACVNCGRRTPAESKPRPLAYKS